jgi:hypothetical protein
MEKHMDLKTSTCLAFENSTDSATVVTGEVRTLVVGWLVMVAKGPLILTVKERNAREAYEKAIAQDSTASIQKMTVHVERFRELGRNLFKPLPANVTNVMEYRNKVIKEWHNTVSNIKGSNPEIVWNRVAKRNGIEGVSASEFNQWVLDHMKYTLKVL